MFTRLVYSPMEYWSDRKRNGADEPHDQGGHGLSLSLRDHRKLREHLDTFLCAYNFARRLKAFKGLTPYRFIVKSWADNPNAFLRDPSHLNMGLCTTNTSIM